MSEKEYILTADIQVTVQIWATLAPGEDPSEAAMAEIYDALGGLEFAEITDFELRKIDEVIEDG